MKLKVLHRTTSTVFALAALFAAQSLTGAVHAQVLAQDLQRSRSPAPEFTPGAVLSVPFTVPMMAGQNINIGQARCDFNPVDPLSGACDLSITNGWCVGLVHAYVAVAPPQSMAPGQFPFRADPTGCVTSVRVNFSIPRFCGLSPVYFAIHAEAAQTGGGGETAWALGTPTTRNWSMAIAATCFEEPT